MPTQQKRQSTTQQKGQTARSSSTSRSSSGRGSTSGARSSTSRSPSRSTSRSAGSSKDAIALLTKDHRTVQKIFKQAEKLDRQEDSEELQQLVQTACEELTLHAQLEEELFYPRVAEMVQENDQDLVQEALVEHNSAKQLIAQLEQMGPEDESYQATFKVLGEYVNHHIEEEERQIFPKAKKAKVDLEEIGQMILERKQAAGKDEDSQ